MIWIPVFLVSLLAVGLYRRIALHRHWFDVPNSRSSHTAAVPRGAGVIFAGIIIAGIVYIAYRGGRWWIALSFLPSGCIALTGWLDDVRGLSARMRLVIYALACAAAVAAIAQIEKAAFQSPLLPAIALAIVAVTGMVWWVNLYNFMDGINGIAALQGIFICAAATGLQGFAAGHEQAVLVSQVIIAALAGFLPWNFPHARVFMGDAGSAFLGGCIGTLALWSVSADLLTIWQWLILAGVFIVDATYTLCYRLLTGQRWHMAHRTHTYQRLSDRLGSHAAVDAVLMLVNIVWLLPLAWLATGVGMMGFVYLLLAYTPLVVACFLLGAGKHAASE